MKNNLPKSIIRIDDGAEFVLNKNNTYSLKLDLKDGDHIAHQWSYEVLMEVNRGRFKVRTTETDKDLEAIKKEYYSKLFQKK